MYYIHIIMYFLLISTYQHCSRAVQFSGVSGLVAVVWRSAVCISSWVRFPFWRTASHWHQQIELWSHQQIVHWRQHVFTNWDHLVINALRLRAPCRNTDFSLQLETLWASCESAAFVLSAAFDVQLGTAGTAGRVFRVVLGIAMAIQMSPYLMSAFQAKSPAKDSAMDTLTEKSDNSGKTQQPISRGPQAEKLPLPGFVKRELHEQGRCEPCLFKYNAGCWYGDECRYCHLCTQEQVRRKQSRRFYQERALRKEKKLNQAQGAPSMCFHMVCNVGFWISNGSLSKNAWRLMIK